MEISLLVAYGDVSFVQQFRQRHRDFGKEMEKVGGMRVSGTREIPAGMEEQNDYSASVHAQGTATR